MIYTNEFSDGCFIFLKNLENICHVFSSFFRGHKEKIIVTISDENNTDIFKEQYYSYSGLFNIYDLDTFLAAYFTRTNGIIDKVMQVKLTIEEFEEDRALESYTFSFYVVYSELIMNGIDAENFLEKNFLTQNKIIYTDVDSISVLSFVAFLPLQFDLSIDYYDSSGVYKNLKYQYYILQGGGNDIHNFTLDWASIFQTKNIDTPISAVVTTVDGHAITFKFLRDLKPAVRFAYVNVFGCLEHISVPGIDENTMKYENSSAFINSVEKVYEKKYTPANEITTGIMTNSEALRMREMFSSHSVFLLDDNNQIEYQVILTDIEDTISSSNDALHSFKFTFCPADKRLYRKPVSSSSGIFDDTFDNTFN